MPGQSDLTEQRKGRLNFISRSYLIVHRRNEDHIRQQESDQHHSNLSCAPLLSDRHGGAAQRELSLARRNLHGGIHRRGDTGRVGSDHVPSFSREKAELRGSSIKERRPPVRRLLGAKYGGDPPDRRRLSPQFRTIGISPPSHLEALCGPSSCLDEPSEFHRASFAVRL